MEGYKTYRHKDNPKEKELHDKIIKDISYNPNDINFIVFGQKTGTLSIPNDKLSDREKRIVISTIQWLGSSIGQSFLEECGFKLT